MSSRDVCGDCRYYEKSGCSHSNYNADHDACKDFEEKK